MARAFFTIFTRTFPGRETLLARCKASVRAQTFQAVEHVILTDEIGVGVAEAQKAMWHTHPRGEYVFVLDDDDYLSAPDVLEKLHAALKGKQVSFAVVKVAHGILGEMPMEWEQVPTVGRITVSNVIVENVVWCIHRKDFTPEYAGDYAFVSSLFAKHMPLWIDLVVVNVELMRNGQAERVSFAEQIA